MRRHQATFAIFAVVIALIELGGRAEAGVILQTPPGLSPDDQFRFVFVTDGIRDATSTNIADYDAFVQAEAGGATYAGALVHWIAIASTDSTDAIDHVGQTDAPVFLSDGTPVTSSTTLTGLWQGALVHGIDLDLLGNTVSPVFFVWTGTNSFGTGFGGPLGSATPTVGSTTSAAGAWTASGRSSRGDPRQLYGISALLTVPDDSVPEPSVLTLFGVALGCRWAFRHRRRAAALGLATALVVIPLSARADVVTEWNSIAVDTVSADRVVNRQSRDMAMVHAAMFDAMNAIRPRYTPALVLITARGYASREAAAAQAAHDVLLALFPTRQADLDADLATSLAQIPDDDAHGHRPKYWGIKSGQVAAAAVLAARQNDHAFDSVPFTPSAGAGEYAFTPGCNAGNLSVPGWGNVTPFTAPDPDYFPTAASPALTDPEWLASLAEVRAYGAANSTVRTADQLDTGLFFIEPSLSSMNRLARELVAQEPIETNRAAASKQLLAHARLFAALNIAQADTYIRTWRVKYREHFWRPYTAINFIYPGSNWTPARQTPCHPEFYAAHGTLTPAGVSAIQHYLGGDAVDVTVTSTSLPGATRHYASLNQIIQDVNAARIYTGFHYRSTLVRSNALGIAVAGWVDEHMMTMLDEQTGDRDRQGPDDSL